MSADDEGSQLGETIDLDPPSAATPTTAPGRIDDNIDEHTNNNDSVGSKSDLFSTGKSSTSQHRQQQQENEDPQGNTLLKLITHQAEAVYSTRTLLSLILLGLAAGFAFAFYILVLRIEQEQFEQDFDEFGLSVINSVLSNTYRVFAELDSIGVYITSMVLHSQVMFQLGSTLNNFGRITQRTFNILPVDVIDYSPIIWKDQRDVWEVYATNSNKTISSSSRIFNVEGPLPQDAPGPFVPLWHTSSFDLSHEERVSQRVNFDMLSYPEFRQAFQWMLRRQHGVISEPITDWDALYTFTGKQRKLDQEGLNDQIEIEPYSFVIQPVFDGLGVGQHQVAGVVTALVPLSFVLQASRGGSKEFVTVIHDSCIDKKYTYDLYGPRMDYLGPTDRHDRQFDSLVVSMPENTTVTSYVSRASGNGNEGGVVDIGDDECPFMLSVYPTTNLQDKYLTSLPWVVFGVVLGIFVCMGCLFARYDVLLTRRQNSLMNHALRTTNILESLFPSNVHQRMFETSTGNTPGGTKNNKKVSDLNNVVDAMNRSMGYGKEDEADDDNQMVVNGMYTTKPIADLFPHTTIMFADIVGFTAWSSQREPTQVFALLETLFRAFDKIAKKLQVFKVETIGDCYVAVSGLPHPRDDHAIVMANFCKECMDRMMFLVRHMEVTLGPDTGDLSMRFGLHSGPVTAGVLRGEKSRFQLFGDSVNTAARIETTGERGKIHMSHETAELLISAGHSKWVAPRRDLVTAKGKGVLRTYWLVKDVEADGGADGGVTKSADFSLDTEDGWQSSNNLAGLSGEKDSAKNWGNSALAAKGANRLIDWNVEVLITLLKSVLQKRRKEEKRRTASTSDATNDPLGRLFRPSLAVFSSGEQSTAEEEEEIEISPQVQSELRAYVALMANMYRNHPFHNFEHASHVMLSITKLMSRIADPKLEDLEHDDDESLREARLHECTFGIASDPLLQFAIAFSALIHDVDHAGVPNVVLMKEDINLAKKYRNKSVAEKHSIRLSWERLMDSDYHEFRQCLCPTQSELKRFRNFVVNLVMATDIADKELNAKRKERWSQCFDDWPEEPTQDDIQRKATIVIEHLMQASDVAHTMQHFEVFKKWNKNLFFEMYQAYEDGRSDTDPSLGWYHGEIGFFDFYIIPLAKKLGTCGVFGVSSDEYLNYAQENKKQWEKHGKEHVEEWVKLRKEMKEKRASKDLKK